NVMVSLRENHELDPNDTFGTLSGRILGFSGRRKPNIKGENIDYLREALDDFETRWEKIERAASDDHQDNPTEQPQDEQGTMRTVTVPLQAILRHDIKDTHYRRITDIINKTQQDMTIFKADLSAIQRLCLLAVCGGSLVDLLNSDDGGLNPSPLFKMCDILPPDFVILDKDMPTTFPLAPLDPRFQKAMDDPANAGPLSELEKLFSNQHFQFLQSRHVGSVGTQDATKARHPLWETLSKTIEEAALDHDVQFAPAPPNRSSLFSSTARQMAAATENMWSGPLYKKSLDAIASLLDLWLRPLAEEKKRRAAIERAEARQKKKEKEEKSPRTLRKKFREQTRQLMNELADALRAHDPDKGQDRLCKLDTKIRSAPPRQVQQNREPLEPFQVDWTLESVTVHSKGKQKRTGEPSIAAVKVLKGIFKMLVQSPAINEDVDGNWVRKCVDDRDKLDLVMDDYKKVAKLVNVIRPFVPKRHCNAKYSHSPALCAPVVLIADTVLRLTGKHHKTREWSPDVAGSDLHAIHVTPAALYQMLCSQHAGQFDVKNHQGQYLTVRTINHLENKELLFMYVDEKTVRLEGDVIKHGDGRNGYPTVDYIDARKKAQKTKKTDKKEVDNKKDEKGKKRQREEDQNEDQTQSCAGAQGSSEQTQPKMSKEQLASELTAVRDQLSAMDDDVKQSNRELARLEGFRNYSRNLYDRAKKAGENTDKVWGDLLQARKVVADHRENYKAMQDLHTVLKEEAWVLQQELNAIKQAERRTQRKHGKDGPSADPGSSSTGGQASLSIVAPQQGVSSNKQGDGQQGKRQKTWHSDSTSQSSLGQPSSSSPGEDPCPGSRSCTSLPATQESTSVTTATWDRHKFCEDAKHINIEPLLSQGTVVFAATDNGIVTTTTTTRASPQQLDQHISYYRALQDLRGKLHRWFQPY
ncbi:hypothetical protein BGZ70_009728, partial [Mortierella alpina]